MYNILNTCIMSRNQEKRLPLLETVFLRHSWLLVFPLKSLQYLLKTHTKKNIRDKTNHWQQCYKSSWMKNVPILYNYEYIKITITWIMKISSINFSNANIKWTSLSWTISMILTVSYLHDLCLMPRLLKKYEIVKHVHVWKVLCLDFEPLIAV